MASVFGARINTLINRLEPSQLEEFKETYPEFICPLSSKIMREPFRDDNGVSYDFKAVLKVRRGEAISPSTNLLLSTIFLLKNRPLNLNIEMQFSILRKLEGLVQKSPKAVRPKSPIIEEPLPVIPGDDGRNLQPGVISFEGAEAFASNRALKPSTIVPSVPSFFSSVSSNSSVQSPPIAPSAMPSSSNMFNSHSSLFQNSSPSQSSSFSSQRPEL